MAAVSTGWSAYFANLMSPFFELPTALSGAYNPAEGTVVNIVAVVIVLLIGPLLRGGIELFENARCLKIGIIILFIIV